VSSVPTITVGTSLNLTKQRPVLFYVTKQLVGLSTVLHKIIKKFRNSASVSDPLPKPTKLQHHTTLCTDCSTSLVSSLNLISVCLWKMPSFEGYFCYGCPEFNVTCISVLLYLEEFRSNK